MISLVKALFYALFHPYQVDHFTIVRRYVDAQKHFIGELYLGEGRTAKMIGMSCDNLPFSIGSESSVAYVRCSVRYDKDFLAPMPSNSIRVGGTGPDDHASVVELMSLRRFCERRITVLNRFVEHVLENEHV